MNGDQRRPGDTEIEVALRGSLTHHAGGAPAADPVAARILAEVERPAARSHRSWPAWSFPLITAGAVAAVVITAVGVSNLRPDAATTAPAAHSPLPAATSSSGGPDAVINPAPTASGSRSAAPGPVVGTSSAAPTPSPVTQSLSGVRVLDLSFVGPDNGWAIGTADCLTGSGRCSALLRTHDGRTWVGMKGTPFAVDGTTRAAGAPVRHVRFADDSVGYAYGPDVLFMTRDGGSNWNRQPGLGADALETLGGTVIIARALDTSAARPALLETARSGSSRWTPHPTSAFPAGATRVSLARTGRVAVLAVSTFDSVRGTGGAAAGVVLRSGDDGRSWRPVSSTCPSAGRGPAPAVIDANVSADGTVALACGGSVSGNTGRVIGGTVFSTDRGASFSAPRPHKGRFLQIAPATELAVASSTVQLVATRERLFRSTDSGFSFTPVRAIPSGPIDFVGFESGAVGRVVSDGGRTVWTTRDAGRTFTRVDLP